MKRSTLLFTLALITLVLGSCIKDEKIRYKLSGVWEIQEATVTYYENGAVTKETVYKDLGFFALEDNGIDSFNRCHYKFKQDSVLRSIFQIANHNTGLLTKEDECRWSSDWYESKRLNLIQSGTFVYDYFVTYTIDKKSSKKYEWVYVERGVDSTNQGSIKYKEVLTLKRK